MLTKCTHFLPYIFFSLNPVGVKFWTFRRSECTMVFIHNKWQLFMFNSRGFKGIHLLICKRFGFITYVNNFFLPFPSTFIIPKYSNISIHTDFVFHAKCTIFWLNGGMRMYMPDFPKGDFPPKMDTML